jgi:hypothetical protein
MVGVRLSRTEACPSAVESFPISGGLVLRPPHRNRLVVVNEVAAIVWELFTAGMPVTEITACLLERFREPRAQVAAEVDRLIAEWKTEGLLEASRPPAVPARTGLPPTSTEPLLDATIQLSRASIRIRSFVRELGPMIVGRLSHHRVATTTAGFTVDVHPDGPEYFALCDGHEVVREDDVPHTVSSLYRLLLRLDNPGETFIAFMHAACLVSNGRAILLCGCSGRGKTTLAAGLLGRGWTYLGDEIAGVVARDFSIRSLPTALSVKIGGMAAITRLLGAVPRSWPSTVDGAVEAFVDARALGPTGSETGRPTAIVFPRFTEGVALVSTRLTPLESFAELIDAGIAVDHSLFGGSTPDRLIEFVETTAAYRLTYGTFDDACRGVHAIVGG